MKNLIFLVLLISYSWSLNIETSVLDSKCNRFLTGFLDASLGDLWNPSFFNRIESTGFDCHKMVHALHILSKIKSNTLDDINYMATSLRNVKEEINTLSNHMFPKVGFSLRRKIQQYIPTNMISVFDLFNKTMGLYEDPLEVAGRFLVMCKNETAECGLIEGAFKMLDSDYYLSGIMWSWLNQYISAIDVKSESLNNETIENHVEQFMKNESAIFQRESLKRLFFVGLFESILKDNWNASLINNIEEKTLNETFLVEGIEKLLSEDPAIQKEGADNIWSVFSQILDLFFPKMGFTLRTVKIPRVISKEYQSIFVILERITKLFEYRESLVETMRRNYQADEVLKDTMLSFKRGNYFSFGYYLGVFCSKIMEDTLLPELGKSNFNSTVAIEEKVKALLLFQKASKSSLRFMN